MRSTIQWTVTSIVSIGLLAGCPAREVAEVDPTPAREDKKDIPVSINRAIDILFVIDNSGSMQDEQDSLAANFVKFIEVLEGIEGGLPDVHIGVISTDLGSGPFAVQGCGGSDNGNLQSTPRGACQAPQDAFIIDVSDGDGGRIRNYDDSTDQLEDVFSCVARLGIDGCGFEQPLEAVRRALDNNPTNTGFIREDAFLAVIILSDEDDCSIKDPNLLSDPQANLSSELGPLSSFRCFEFGVECTPDNPRAVGNKGDDCTPRDGSPFMFDVQEYVEFLQSLKSDPSLVIVAGIIGDPGPVTVSRATINGIEQAVLDPSCGQANEQNAAPGVRLASFVDSFPGRGTRTTICNDDLSDALVLVATLLAQAIGNPCIEANIDLDPNVAGVQENCTVSDEHRDTRGAVVVEQLLPECATTPPDPSDAPCWFLQPEPNCSEFPTGHALVVERGGVDPIPVSGATSVHVVAHCEVAGEVSQ